MITKKTNFSNPISKESLWKALRDLEGEYIVHVYKEDQKRDLSTNKYYWGYIIDPIVKHTVGVDDSIEKNKIHDILGVLFKEDVEVTDKDGNVSIQKESTSNMSKARMFEYMESCIAWADSFLGLKLASYGEANGVHKSKI